VSLTGKKKHRSSVRNHLGNRQIVSVINKIMPNAGLEYKVHIQITREIFFFVKIITIQVFTAVNIEIEVFWVLTPCSVVVG
jgi:hypothetical protein